MISSPKNICRNDLLSFFSGIFTLTARLKKKQKQQHISLLTICYPKSLNNFEFLFTNLFGFNPSVKKKKKLNTLYIYKKSQITLVLNCIAPYIIEKRLLKEIEAYLINVSSKLPTFLSNNVSDKKFLDFWYYYLGFFSCAVYYKILFSKVSLFESIKFMFLIKHKDYGLLKNLQQFLYNKINVSSSLYFHNNLYILHIQSNNNLLYFYKYCLTNFEPLVLSNKHVLKTIVLILLIKTNYLTTLPLYAQLIKKLYWVLRFDS